MKKVKWLIVFLALTVFLLIDFTDYIASERIAGILSCIVTFLWLMIGLYLLGSGRQKSQKEEEGEDDSL